MGNLSARSRWKITLAVVPLVFAWHSAAAAVAVIGSPNISVDSLNKDQVAEIFLGKRTTLPDGTRLVVIEHQDGEALKDEFYDKVVGKSPSQLKAYWAKLVFTGEGLPPRAFSGDKNVKNRVSVTPGAIGYISAESVDNSVKVLFEQK